MNKFNINKEGFETSIKNELPFDNYSLEKLYNKCTNEILEHSNIMQAEAIKTKLLKTYEGIRFEGVYITDMSHKKLKDFLEHEDIIVITDGGIIEQGELLIEKGVYSMYYTINPVKVKLYKRI